LKNKQYALIDWCVKAMGKFKLFDVKHLKPFRKLGDPLPGSAAEEGQLRGVDADLQPDEERYIRHYLNYADVLLAEETTPEASEKVAEFPLPDDRRIA
jgi:hypothetical protein